MPRDTFPPPDCLLPGAAPQRAEFNRVHQIKHLVLSVGWRAAGRRRLHYNLSSAHLIDLWILNARYKRINTHLTSNLVI